MVAWYRRVAHCLRTLDNTYMTFAIEWSLTFDGCLESTFPYKNHAVRKPNFPWIAYCTTRSWYTSLNCATSKCFSWVSKPSYPSGQLVKWPSMSFDGLGWLMHPKWTDMCLMNPIHLVYDSHGLTDIYIYIQYTCYIYVYIYICIFF